ncbi:hypothetical protein PENPOL_c002G10254 [Penicillium polonicum]|uniref:DUF6546 domain-containing protein n=1 Tax=Penicillium polonicum TaxID=60169 RepID=A0A1V6NXW8_PENPO|nr:hypothetical protein PENPOL_c002G10254 [Penicillium polonicum]
MHENTARPLSFVHKTIWAFHYIILEYIAHDDLHLAKYATISRDWQAIIESKTFSSLKINTPRRLAEFNELSWDRRRSYVRKVDLIIQLESYYDDNDACTRYENEGEMQRNNKIFTTSIHSLFITLAKWPAKEEAKFSLSIEARSPDDLLGQTPEAKREREKRIEESYPNFADSILLWPASIRQLHLGFCYVAPFDQNYSPAASTVKGKTDPLSSRLREFSQQLKEMGGAQCVLGKEVFWPTDEQNHNIQLPFWPHFTDLWLGYEPVTPSGNWMFAKEEPQESEDEDDHDSSDPGSDYNEMDDTDKDWDAPEDRMGKIFRTKPIHELFNAYYLSAANAALCMPKLDNMFLEVTNGWNRQEFWYRVRDEVANATWSSGDDPKAFEPSDEVLQLWKQVASARTGGDLGVEVDLL